MNKAILFVTAIGALVAGTCASADTLSYTDQHVIAKDGTDGRRNRPEKVDPLTIKLGNFTIDVPTLAATTPVSMVNTSVQSTAASAFLPQQKASAKPNTALFELTKNRIMSVVDEARFKELIADGAAEVWAPKDAHSYLDSLMPRRDENETPIRTWVDCTSGCENRVWIERRGVVQ